jgi:hypothetical protein
MSFSSPGDLLLFYQFVVVKGLCFSDAEAFVVTMLINLGIALAEKMNLNRFCLKLECFFIDGLFLHYDSVRV